MDQAQIKSKIDEIANGDIQFAVNFADMTIKDLNAFPGTVADALNNRDLRKLTYTNHQLKTIIGLFDMKDLNRLIENSLELFEKDESQRKEFLKAVQVEVDKYTSLINDSVKPYRQALP